MNVNGVLTESSRSGNTGTLSGDFVFAGRPIERSQAAANTKYNPEDVFDFRSYHIMGSPANIGVALDLGFEWRLLNDHLKLSAAIADLGFISWDQSSSIEGTMGTAFSYEGIDIESGDVIVTSDEFEFAGKAASSKYAKRMNCSLNFGAEYAILRNRISFGLLSHSKFCQTYSFSELTASVNFKPVNWLTASFSHTLLNKNQPGVFGFALNLHPTGLNIFLGADFIDTKMAPWSSTGMLLPVRQRSMNLNFGLGFSLGRAKYSKAYKADMEARQAKKSAK